MAGVLLGFAVAAGLPVVLFRQAVLDLLERPYWDQVYYLAGWTPWVLLGSGLLFMVPVVASAGLSPESRFFPRARAAYAGWGVTLYLLGFLLAWQVVRIQSTGIS